MSEELTFSRLRTGELVAAGGGLLELVLVFAVKRDGLKPAPLRWLSLMTGISAVLLAYFQAKRRAPALPASLSVVASALGAISTISLLVRVLAARPAAGSHRRLRGAYLGLGAALAITCGGYRSMRQEGGTDPNELGAIETLKI